MFEVEIGVVRKIIGSQSWGRPNGHKKMSSEPSFGAPGGHIFDVVARGLKKHLFTAKLAQHVASEPRVHFLFFLDLKVSN
jgi:hypothetical protein